MKIKLFRRRKSLSNTTASQEGGLSALYDKLPLLLNLLSEEDKLDNVLEEEWWGFQSLENVEKPLSKSMYASILGAIKPSKKILPFHRNFVVYKYAAALILVAVCSALIFYYQPKHAPAQVVVLQTKIGEVKNYTLPDSSKVYLNSGSSLTYDPSFKERKISLVGEAYFQIKKVKGKNFQIHADQLNIEVLGTSFTVTSFKDEPYQIAVSEGKVKVLAAEGALPNYLQKGEGIRYFPQQKEFSKVFAVEESSVSAWTNNILVFDDKTFEEVTQILERRFGKQIVFSSDVLKDCQLSGRHKADSLAVILKSIKFVLGCSYEYVGDQVRVSGPGC